jgi:hypothetical protein
MPEYLYGLILIDSLAGEVTRGAAHPIDSPLWREMEAILTPRREEKSKAIHAGAGSLARAGA